MMSLQVGYASRLNSSFTRSLPRAAEMEAFGASLNGGAAADTLSGHRVFYDSDYVVFRRPRFAVTVKMHSTRTIPTECGNEEGKQGRSQSDGVTSVFLSGREFEDVYPVWDWRLLPGTVEVHNATRFTCGQKPVVPGTYVGGVSDGLNGAASFDYRALIELKGS